MAYRYQWVWQWDATRNFAGTTEELLGHIESQIREKMGEHPEITGVESVTHSGVKYWTENLGITRRWQGYTTTVFLSTEAPSSPAVPAILIAIILGLVLVAIIAAIIYFIVSSISNLITYLGEKAPVALTLGAAAILVIAVVGGYLLIKERKPIERLVKERVVPAAERAAEALHV